MRKIAGVLLALALCASASAFDYNAGQIPCAGCQASGPVEANWGWGSTPNFIPNGDGTFSDTVTFYAGDWSESATYYPPYGASYNFTSSQQLSVHGVTGKHCSSGRGGGSYCSTAVTTITSATLDGVPLVQSGINWVLQGSLSPGSHVIAVTGTATTTSPQGVTTPGGYYCIWGAGVEGILYTLVYNTAPTGHDD